MRATAARSGPDRGRSSTPTETELKLAVAPADLRSLRRRIVQLAPRAKPLRRTVDSVYYDTADGLLAQHRMALRVRRVAGRWVQTLKTGAENMALVTRGEWEMSAPSGRLDLVRFAGTPLEQLLAQHPQARLTPRFRTRFTRTQWLIRRGSGATAAAIEVALDVGEISTDDNKPRRAAICEVELELKAGAPQALPALALFLIGSDEAAPLALRPEGRSKAARGNALARGESLSPVKADASALSPHRAMPLNAGARGKPQPKEALSANAALRAVIAAGANVLAANAAGLLETDDPEFVHQARVALRRMRGAIRQLRRHVSFPPELLHDLEWIARELGAARDDDVFVASTLPALLRDVAGDSDGATRIAAAARRCRQKSRAAARAAVASPRFARLVLESIVWAMRLDEKTGPTMRAIAALLIDATHLKLKRAARGFRKLSAAKRHRVRIAAKRLRYALDLFAFLLPSPATTEYIKRLAQLQDALGAMNDAAVARHSLREIAKGEWVERAGAHLEELESTHIDAAASLLVRLRRIALPVSDGSADLT